MKSIVIRGARENNLKDLNLEIPRDKLTVVTGLSGSGKSSLAFDTIFAEGQRRYVESLSAYVRQFLEQQGKPDVDSIDGLSPAIAIEQRTLGKNPRSTVGTITEIYDYLRLLYARVGRPHCPRCGKRVSSQSVQQIIDSVLSSMPEGTRFSVLAPLCRDKKGELKKELDSLRREGFSRINLDGELRELAEELVLDRGRPHTIEVYVDRLALRPGIETRLADSLELALKLGSGVVKIAPLEGQPLLFSERLACIDCGLSLPDLTPRAFSFNNPAGACPRCSGLGVLMELDEARIVPHPELSLREGAIEPWEGRNAGYYQGVLEALAQQFGFDLFTPYAELPTSVRTLLMKGSGEIEVAFSLDRGSKRGSYRRPFEGVLANLERRLEAEEQRRKEGGGAELEGVDELCEEYHRFMRARPCPECDGARLRVEARSVSLGGRPIHAVTRLAVGQALAFFSELALEERERRIAGRLLEEITARLSFLVSVGLDYLSLDRTSASLSGGEGQRVRLATQIGSALTGVIYILDEPSIGLHKRDHRRLLGTLLALRDRGNTVLVVEHDEETIRAADHIVDLGPGAGTRGGELVASGTLEEIVACPRSLTGQYLSGARRIEVPRVRRRARRHLRLLGASSHNLKQIDLELPLAVLCCVTGVSGSGKSTLICDTLLPAVQAALGGEGDGGGYRALEGASALTRVIAVDQAPVGRSPRSNPATYTGVFAKIRELFAALPESKLRGYKAGRYSFNVKGGRCEACQGEGILRIAMHFLPDVFVACEVCGGRRYDRETLQVKYRGASIADLLAMTVDDALDLLGNLPPIRQKLEALRAVGLGYLTLGQGANTLSGGEAQRLKLSRELSRSGVRKEAPLPRRGQKSEAPHRGGTLYVLDEPTSGLHLADIQVLLEVLGQLVDAGQSVVVIEHHLDVIKTADWVIDLGPEGGEGGGRIVAAGTPEEVARTAGSNTGECLRPVLGL